MLLLLDVGRPEVVKRIDEVFNEHNQLYTDATDELHKELTNQGTFLNQTLENPKADVTKFVKKELGNENSAFNQELKANNTASEQLITNELTLKNGFLNQDIQQAEQNHTAFGHIVTDEVRKHPDTTFAQDVKLGEKADQPNNTPSGNKGGYTPSSAPAPAPSSSNTNDQNQGGNGHKNEPKPDNNEERWSDLDKQIDNDISAISSNGKRASDGEKALEKVNTTLHNYANSHPQSSESAIINQGYTAEQDDEVDGKEFATASNSFKTGVNHVDSKSFDKTYHRIHGDLKNEKTAAQNLHTKIEHEGAALKSVRHFAADEKSMKSQLLNQHIPDPQKPVHETAKQADEADKQEFNQFERKYGAQLKSGPRPTDAEFHNDANKVMTDVSSHLTADTQDAHHINNDMHIDEVEENAVSHAEHDNSERLGDLKADEQAEAKCYVTGTKIKTVRGEIPVEALKVGDLVITARGAQKPIKWIGFQEMAFGNGIVSQRNTPICIKENALADGVPYQDLYVSPAHALAFRATVKKFFFVSKTRDFMTRAGSLLNHETIFQVPTRKVTYWHVELENHDLLVANGVFAESYQDMGNRHGFTNGATIGIHSQVVLEKTSYHDVLPRKKGGCYVRAIRKGIKEQALRLRQEKSRKYQKVGCIK